jgi:hypothetical protein
MASVAPLDPELELALRALAGSEQQR